MKGLKLSNKKIKVRVGDTVFCYKNCQNGVVLGFFKSMSGESLVAIDYGLSWAYKGVLVEKEKDVIFAFGQLIEALCKEGLNHEQATFFAPSYYQSLDRDADLIKIKQYLSLK
jgi:hypothetical protein